MLLANFLDAKLIYFEPRIVSKDQVYQELIKRIKATNPLQVSSDKLLDMILARDSESSTAYPTGIAIPHVRLEGLDDTIVSMCWLNNPIDYDGTKVCWIVLIISDKSSSKLYLNIVSSLMKISKDEYMMSVLKKEHDGHGVIYTLKKANVLVKQSLCVSDIMVTEVITTSPDLTLSGLSSLINEKNVAFMPVVNDSGKYLGEVNILNLLKVGVPDYLMMMNNLSFLQSFEPLENLFKKEDEILVKEIMSQNESTLDPEASIIETVFKMIQSGKRYYAVVAEGKLVGIVTAMDVFKKVLKA